MHSAEIEQNRLEVRREIERFKEDVATLKAQFAGLEQAHLRSSVWFQKLSKYFGFGAAGKLDWVRFKLKYKEDELKRVEAEQARLDALANRSEVAPELQAARPAGFSR